MSAFQAARPTGLQQDVVMDRPRRLKIVHVVRSPIGGIFRHIVDLVDAQTKAGHDVGIICDSLTGGCFEDGVIANMVPKLALGAIRFPMRRSVSLSDFVAVRRVMDHLRRVTPGILHCHGAKGGAYGRLIAAWLGRRRPIASIYAPHGGSLHYDEHSLEGRFYFRIERTLERVTDALVHVSTYEAEVYRHKVGIPRCRASVIRNGLREEEFAPVTPRNDARDLLFLGMLRDLKGVDIFLEAIAKLDANYGRKLTAHVIGQAEEPGRYEALAGSLGIADRVAFSDPVPTRDAFASARMIVVPSRAESMPYVVLEAIAAGMPIVASDVGGIPDAAALARAIDDALSDPRRTDAEAAARRAWLHPRFNIAAMQNKVEALYRQMLDDKYAAAA
jgi:glycosyltransferase involved in cell wall biosynthesis